jgi:hypothetical protein
MFNSYSIASLFLALILLGTSCASKSDKAFIAATDSDLVESFEIKDPKLEKFKTAPLVVEESAKEIVASKPTEKIVEQKKKGKQSPKIEVTQKGPEYPEGYPEILIGYDKQSSHLWDKFKPRLNIGETFTFEVSYMGITAGHIRMSVKPPAVVNGRAAFHFVAQLRSARYYEYVYKLDDTLETFVDRETMIPVKYSLMQRESGQSVDDLQIFDADAHKTYFWYKRLKKGQEKKEEKEEFIPKYFQDSYSTLYFVRGFPLKNGDVYKFPIITRAKLWMLTIKVTGRETIEVNGKKISAIRLDAETQFPGVLSKKGDITFWYSDDQSRRLLKFGGKVKIGTVEGELIEYSSGQDSAAADDSARLPQ